MLLAGVGIFHAFVVAKEEFSIKKLHAYHSKDEMEEEINDQNVEHVF